MCKLVALSVGALLCIGLGSAPVVAQEEAQASPSEVPRIEGLRPTGNTLTVEVGGLVGMEGLRLWVWELCRKGPSTASFWHPVLESVAIDASPFAASGSLVLPACPSGFHELFVMVGESPDDWRHACSTAFDLGPDEDVSIGIVGLSPKDDGGACQVGYLVHDPGPLSWLSPEPPAQ